jgi:hypothetical protein
VFARNLTVEPEADLYTMNADGTGAPHAHPGAPTALARLAPAFAPPAVTHAHRHASTSSDSDMNTITRGKQVSQGREQLHETEPGTRP